MVPAFAWTSEEYAASNSAEAREQFRRHCLEAASYLRRNGREPEVIQWRFERKETPRKFLGISLRPTVEVVRVPDLVGWWLVDQVSVMGTAADGEWYQWSDLVILAQDGQLVRGRREREQKSPQPVSEKTTFWPFRESDFYEVDRRRDEGNYRALFPGVVGEGMQKLLNGK